MKLIQDNEKGKVFQVDECKIYYRKKGSISGDNAENLPKEFICYLVPQKSRSRILHGLWKLRHILNFRHKRITT